MSKVEKLGLDWAARSLDGDQWIQFLEEDVRQHPQSALEWERHRSRGQGQDAPVARDTAGFSDPPPSILQGVAAAGQTAGTVPAFQQGAQIGQALLQAAVQPDEPTEPGLFKAAVLPDDGSPHLLTKVADEAALAALRGQQPPPVAPAVEQAPGEGGLKTIALQPDPMRKAAVELDMPAEHHTAPIKAARTSTSMREGIEAGVRSAQPEPDFKQAMGAIVEAVRVACKVDIQAAVWAGMLSGQVQTEPMRKAAVELDLISELPAPKPVGDAAPAAMRAPGVAAPAAPAEPQEAGNGLKTLAPRPPEVLLKPAVQPEGGEMIQATQAEVSEARAEVVLVREQVTLVREQPAVLPAPAPVAATPAPVAAQAPPVAAAPVPAPAPAGPTPEQIAKMREVWQTSAASDPFQVLRWMDEFGMNVSQAAQAAGVSEFELSCLLVRLGVPKGYAGLSFSREEVNADFEAQLKAAVSSGQFRKRYDVPRGDETDHFDGFDMAAFTQHYLGQNTEASRRFAAVNGQSEVQDSDHFSQAAQFGSGYRVNVQVGAHVESRWAVDERTQAVVSTPKASAQERAEIKAHLEESYGDVLAAYGGGETLPDNAVTASLRAKYGEALATLMYQLDKAMERARNEYIGALQAAVAGTSRQGWVTHTQVVRDELGEAHEVKTERFDQGPMPTCGANSCAMGHFSKPPQAA